MVYACVCVDGTPVQNTTHVMVVTHCTAAEEPMCRLVEHALSFLVECVQRNSGDAGNADIRNAFFRILHSMPLVCKSTLGVAKDHEAFEPLLFYERVRLGISSTHYFLDGIPASLALFDGPTTVSFTAADIGRLRLRDVIADRVDAVSKLENLSDGSKFKRKLNELHLEGMSRGVPMPVRCLVARTRALFQGIRNTHRPSLFKRCDNVNCRRLCYVGEPAESWANGVIHRGDEVDEGSDSSEYWLGTTGAGVRTVPDTRRFCSVACSREHAEHLAQMMPDAGLQMDADDVAKKAGRARVREAFDLALKRNTSAARALRTMRSKSRTNLAVSRDELAHHCQRRITMLNVDLGVLLAAATIAESASLSRGKLLPGMSIYWRDDPFYYAKVLKAVREIYDKTGRRPTSVVSCTTTTPKFLQRVKINAFKMF